MHPKCHRLKSVALHALRELLSRRWTAIGGRCNQMVTDYSSCSRITERLMSEARRSNHSVKQTFPAELEMDLVRVRFLCLPSLTLRWVLPSLSSLPRDSPALGASKTGEFIPPRACIFPPRACIWVFSVAGLFCCLRRYSLGVESTNNNKHEFSFKLFPL